MQFLRRVLLTSLGTCGLVAVMTSTPIDPALANADHAGLASLVTHSFTGTASLPKIKINEVSYDPFESPEGAFEYVELVNVDTITVYLDGMVISDEGNQGTGEATFKFPGTPGGTRIPLAVGAFLLIVADATSTTLPVDYEFYGGSTDTDDPTIPNLTRTAGTADDLYLGNTGDGITLSTGISTGGVIPCSEVIDGVSWEGGGFADTYAMSRIVCTDPASDPGYTNGAGQIRSLQRCPNAADTDNSAVDFVVADRTPKASNGCNIAPPVISRLHYSPCFIQAGQSATVLCSATDPNNDIVAVRLLYRPSTTARFDSLAMMDSGSGLYSATLPGQADQAHILFYVSARDAAGNETRSPSSAPTLLRSYRVGLQTIASLQVPAVNDSCGASTEIGKAVNIVGVVTHLPYEYSDNFFYIQQGTGPNSGIKVFTTIDSSLVPDYGDSVCVSGYVDEFRCQTQVVLYSGCGTILGHNRRVRARTLTSVAAISREENESMLVTISGPISVTDGFDSTNLGSEFQVAVGVDSAYVGDDTFFPDGIGYSIVPTPGMVLDAVTGIVGNRRTDTTPPGQRSNPHITLRLEPRRDNDVDRDYTGVGDDLSVVPVFHLGQNTPNPFNPMTIIDFAVPCPGPVAVRVYDASGRLVRTLVDTEYLLPARGRIAWNGRNDQGKRLPSGVYFYRLEAGRQQIGRKMVLLK